MMPRPPAFFEAGKIYYHPSGCLFKVEFVSPAPRGFEHFSELGKIAFGWRRILVGGEVEGLGAWYTLQFEGWTEVSDRETDLAENPELQKLLLDGIKQANSGQTHDLGDFTKSD